jgi:hypothetical protein
VISLQKVDSLLAFLNIVLRMQSAFSSKIIYFFCLQNRMEIRNFHYINEGSIDNDYSQAVGYLITEITSGEMKERQRGAEGEAEVSLGSVLQFLGLKLGIKGNITNKNVDEQEVKQKLTAPNKLAIVETFLKKKGELSELLLDEVSEQDLVKSLRGSSFYLLSGAFTITEDAKEDRRYALFSKALTSNLILIPASIRHMETTRGMDYHNMGIEISAFCYYGGFSSDSFERALITHVFYPRAIWDYHGPTHLPVTYYG